MGILCTFWHYVYDKFFWKSGQGFGLLLYEIQPNKAVGYLSKRPSFVVRLKQLQFSLGNFETKRFSVGIINTKASFCG